MDAIYHWLKEWQDLASGLLAFVAGAATVFFLWLQIKAERDRHNDATYRKGLSHRAQMPDALSGISKFTEECFRWLLSLAEQHELGENAGERSAKMFVVIGAGVSDPTRPRAEIDILKAAIEYADSDTALAVFELVSFYQVHNARAFGEREPNAAEWPDRLYDTTMLRGLAHRLFPYARNQERTVKHRALTRDEMTRALRTGTGLQYQERLPNLFQGIVDKIEERHPQ